MATDLVPESWENWEPYPWVVGGAVLALSGLAAWVAATAQRRELDASPSATLGQDSSQQSGGIAVGINQGTVVYTEPEKPTQGGPMLRINRWDGTKSESVEIFSEELAIAYLQIESTWKRNGETGEGHDDRSNV
ncbi:hypothetical protein FB565_004542 [Actinoplanes lutulentus]|uniref:hypothetical protein n=1 Tax=Actinoplanes lutulentus TaxID=1287878 RepID=UPI0011B943BC|nr:hypothetical protein [Actinoplanes lutulentus]MBB2944809.1 hypothetical protein [Actinoplanes lutulentus]